MYCVLISVIAHFCLNNNSRKGKFLNGINISSSILSSKKARAKWLERVKPRLKILHLASHVCHDDPGNQRVSFSLESTAEGTVQLPWRHRGVKTLSRRVREKFFFAIIIVFDRSSYAYCM